MSQSTNTPANTRNTLKGLINADDVQRRFNEILGKKSKGFISGVLQVVNSSKMLKSADPITILNAAATAAVLDLNITKDLGEAWIVPYKEKYYDQEDRKWKSRVVAQFQIGWKGFVQLAQRTGKYAKINAIPVYKNQFKSWNALTETIDADFSLEPEGEPVGYIGYFTLINGFVKVEYWSLNKITKHATKYSQAYKGKSGPWNDEDQFDSMALKTVIKSILNKWGPKSIEMSTAVQSDQSVQFEANNYHYADNPSSKTIDLDDNDAKKERERALDHIAAASTIPQLEMIKDERVALDVVDEYDERYQQIKQELAAGDQE